MAGTVQDSGASRQSDYPPIADYGLIGDCHTAALVSREGSIDWYCPDRFDAPAVFCRLLDARQGGFWRLAPVGVSSVERRYRGPTAVLETIFRAESGRVRLTDFMPVERRQASRRGRDVRGSSRLLRLVEALDGQPELELEWRPTFDFAASPADCQVLDGGALASSGRRYLGLGGQGIQLRANDQGGLVGRLRLEAGEHRWLVLSYADDARTAQEALGRSDGKEELQRTLEYWEGWAEDCTYHGPYREAVLRSAITLKLLTYEPTGALIAAPTTSLPERIGGPRNWDYRYTWLRDASLMIYALMTIGYRAEASDFFEWLERVQEADPRPVPQILYAVDGGRNVQERRLEHLEGYRGSRPVRVGNGAAEQVQLDIYGEVLGAAHLYFSHLNPAEADSRLVLPDGRPTPEAWALLSDLVEQAGRRWQDPDRGLWEVRSGSQLFLYSRLRCWVALDRGLKLAERFGLDAPLDRWRQIRGQIRQAIETQGYSAEQQAFTQAFGSPHLDASALTIPRLGFLPATDQRVQSTVEQIRQHLVQDGMVYRYRTGDGLPGGEGAFVMCSFWLVDALALGGRVEAACELFESICGRGNDLGLLAEEVEPQSGALLGNFPQGFSHMALIGAAVNLAKAAKHGSEQGLEDDVQRAIPASQAATEGHPSRP